MPYRDRMTPRPELDAETKARIEAEEAYRAQLRAGQTPPATKVISWIIGILGVMTLFYLFGTRNSASMPTGKAARVAVHAQRAPNNTEWDVFMIAYDADGRQVATDGEATVQVVDVVEGVGADTQIHNFTVKASDFKKGTQGEGGFKQDALFARLGTVENPPITSYLTGHEIQLFFKVDEATLKATDMMM